MRGEYGKKAGVNNTQKTRLPAGRSKMKRSILVLFLVAVFLLDLALQSYFRSVGVGVANGGISFGLFPNLSGVITAGIYLIFIVWFFVTIRKGKFQLGLLPLALGGLGNLCSRLLMGDVWDYLRLPPLPFSFNLSDVLIVGGVIYYLWSDARDNGRPSILG